ncbi:MAG: ABC transporter permease [Coriobacteriia bacterium]|nr:ABC transporter permease [Coriobacteriia bacterium]
MRSNLRIIIGYIVAFALIVVFWALASWLIKSPALPLPWDAIEQFFVTLPDTFSHILISLWRVIAAMVLGTVLGLPLGLYIGRSERADVLAAPLLYLLYPIPKVVFLPILMVLLGLGNAPKIILIAVVVFFQMLVTARGAAQAIAPESITSVRSLGASPLQIARHVVLPSSLPDIFTALRISIGTAIAVLFLSESIAGSTGIGYYIMNAWSRLDYVAMFAGIIAMGAMGVGLYEILNIIEYRVIRWKHITKR